MRKRLILFSMISALAAIMGRAQEYRIRSAGCNASGNRIVEAVATTPWALSKGEARALLQKCAIMGLLYRGAEATAYYTAYAPLIQDSPHREQEFPNSIFKKGSPDGIAELIQPVSAHIDKKKHRYEYSAQIAINMNRLRRLVVALGLL